MSKISVVIVHYKGEEETKVCLRSLSNSFQYISVFLVVNDASNFIISEVKKCFPTVQIIVPISNIGFSAANNLGIKQALRINSSYILLLNNDTVASPSLVTNLANYAAKDTSVGLISPKIYFEKGFEYQKHYQEKEKGKVIWYAGGQIDWKNIYAFHRGVDEVDEGQYDNLEETDFCTGCCMLISRKLIEKVGFLDEKYFLYYEDVDYSIRAKQSGFRTLYYPRVFLWHKNAASSGKSGSRIHMYYQTRNRLYFGYKYGSIMTKKSLFIECIRMMQKGAIQRRAIIDFFVRRMGGRY